jgi:hypothetical protein
MYRLSSAVSLGGLPPFLCNASNSFGRIKSISSKVLGFTPYSRLKRVVDERCCLPNNSLENPEGNNNNDNDFLHTLPFGKINALSLYP